jgi:acetyl-CoA acetyltransferase
MKIDDIDLFEVNEAFASIPVGLAEGHWRRPGASTSMAAPSRSAIRSAAPAPS